MYWIVNILVQNDKIRFIDKYYIKINKILIKKIDKNSSMININYKHIIHT